MVVVVENRPPPPCTFWFLSLSRILDILDIYRSIDLLDVYRSKDFLDFFRPPRGPPCTVQAERRIKPVLKQAPLHWSKVLVVIGNPGGISSPVATCCLLPCCGLLQYLPRSKH